MERGIRALVETCEEVGVAREDIIRKIQQKFSLPAEEAQAYLKKYWSEI